MSSSPKLLRNVSFESVKKLFAGTFFVHANSIDDNGGHPSKSILLLIRKSVYNVFQEEIAEVGVSLQTDDQQKRERCTPPLLLATIRSQKKALLCSNIGERAIVLGDSNERVKQALDDQNLSGDKPSKAVRPQTSPQANCGRKVFPSRGKIPLAKFYLSSTLRRVPSRIKGKIPSSLSERSLKELIN